MDLLIYFKFGPDCRIVGGFGRRRAMGFHSRDGQHFLGCRSTPKGRLEVVYDREGGRRMVFALDASAEHASLVSDALRAAIHHRNVVSGLYSEIAARKIQIDATA
jgi:hypothetical protein